MSNVVAIISKLRVSTVAPTFVRRRIKSLWLHNAHFREEIKGTLWSIGYFNEAETEFLGELCEGLENGSIDTTWFFKKGTKIRRQEDLWAD